MTFLPRTRLPAGILVFLIAIALAGCGGGGMQASPSPVQIQPVPSPAVPAPSVPSPTGAATPTPSPGTSPTPFMFPSPVVSPTPMASRMSVSATPCQPDFTFGISQSSATITAGQTVMVGFGMTSLCGLAGTINVGVHGISPQPVTTCKKGKGQVCTSNGPTLQQCCYDFPLPAGGSTGNHITFGATAATVKTTYTITIRGEDITGGCCYGLQHSATFTLTVT